MSGLRTRLITAIFFVGSMIAGIFAHPLSMTVLFVLLPGLCLYEFFGLTLLPSRDDEAAEGSLLVKSRRWLAIAYGVSPSALLAVHYWVYPFPSGDVLFLSGILFLFLSGFFLLELFASGKDAFAKVAYILLGSIYIGIPFAMVIHLGISGDQFRPWVVFGIILLIWANDTFAYLLGSWIGKTKLIPRVSPKKTWEGTLSGVLVTILASWLYYLLFGHLVLSQWLVIGGIIAVLGTIGDLIESMLKRSFKAKDSGGLLPGHGGFLDRFDSFIFVIPFVWVYLMAVGGLS
ncbi:MAG: phosphatidate cytidylyltransferase [Bacteroidota bacterium]